MCYETLGVLVKIFDTKTDEEIKNNYKTKELCSLYRRLMNGEPTTTIKNNKAMLISELRKYITNMKSSFEVRLANSNIFRVLTCDKYENASIFIENMDELLKDALHKKEYADIETDKLINIIENMGGEVAEGLARADIVKKLEDIIEN